MILSELRENIAEAQSEKANSMDRRTLSLRPVPSGEVVAGQIVPVEGEMQTQILKLHAQAAQDGTGDQSTERSKEPKSVFPACPECGSHNTKRRHRSMFERAALSMTSLKAYSCRNCNHTFYFKLQDQEKLPSGTEAAILGSSELRTETDR